MSALKYQIPSPRIAKIKSPLQKRKKEKGGGAEAYVYLNRTEKTRDLVLTKPMVGVSIAPEISAEESLIMRSQVQDYAIRVIQRRIRSFIRRKQQEPSPEEETGASENSDYTNDCSLHLDRILQGKDRWTFYFKSGKVVKVVPPDEEHKK